MAQDGLRWPTVVMCAGDQDPHYGPQRLEAEVAKLRARGADARAITLPGGHEWSEAACAAAGSCSRASAASPRVPR